MDTLSEAMNRLRTEGYVNDFSADEDGRLRCSACGASESPENMKIEVTVRFEGISDPGDEGILLGIHCACGHKGQYSTAYGRDAPFEDAVALRRLTRSAR